MPSSAKSSQKTHERDFSNGSVTGYWPEGVSREPKFSIGQVSKILKDEFPAISVSKLRYFDDEGLVVPIRTATGYRKYSEADVARLRYCLESQRDSYLPLAAILDKLAELDKGINTAEPLKSTRIVAVDGKILAENEGYYTARELIDITGITENELATFIKVGIISMDYSGKFPARAHSIVKLVQILTDTGLGISQLRFLRTNADRLAELVEICVPKIGNQNSAVIKSRRQSQINELGECAGDLFKQLLRVSLEQIN